MQDLSPYNIVYDERLRITSLSDFDDEGVYKTWFLNGNQSYNVRESLYHTKDKRDVLNVLTSYVERYYVAHRSLKFQRVHDRLHKIELKELNIENYNDPKSLLFQMVDEVYARVKKAPESVEFRISKGVWQNLSQKGWLEILRKYKMAREFRTDHQNQEFTLEKKFELAKARLLAKHMPGENNIKPFDRQKLMGGVGVK